MLARCGEEQAMTAKKKWSNVMMMMMMRVMMTMMMNRTVVTAVMPITLVMTVMRVSPISKDQKAGLLLSGLAVKRRVHVVEADA